MIWTYDPSVWDIYEIAGLATLALSVAALCIAGWFASTTRNTEQ